MIKYFRKNCKSEFEYFLDTAAYLDFATEFSARGVCCACCGTKGRFKNHASYSRCLVNFNEQPECQRIEVNRVMCKCSHTHAELGESIVPYSPYSIGFVLVVLRAYFIRDLPVRAICERYGIAVQTLYNWKRKFAEHMALMFGVLAAIPSDIAQRLTDIASDLRGHMVSFLGKMKFSLMQARHLKTPQCLGMLPLGPAVLRVLT